MSHVWSPIHDVWSLKYEILSYNPRVIFFIFWYLGWRLLCQNQRLILCCTVVSLVLLQTVPSRHCIGSPPQRYWFFEQSPVMEESKEASPSMASPSPGKEDEMSDEEMWKADPGETLSFPSKLPAALFRVSFTGGPAGIHTHLRWRCRFVVWPANLAGVEIMMKLFHDLFIFSLCSSARLNLFEFCFGC